MLKSALKYLFSATKACLLMTAWRPTKSWDFLDWLVGVYAIPGLL